MPLWTVEHRVFVYDSFVRSGESVTEVQRLFRRRFNVARHGDIPSRNTILRWVNALRGGGSLTKKKPPGPRRTVRTPQNVERVRQAMLRSPRRSARRHSEALQMSDTSVRRILHQDLHTAIKEESYDYPDLVTMSSTNTLTTVIKEEEPDINEEHDKDIDISDTVIKEELNDYAGLGTMSSSNTLITVIKEEELDIKEEHDEDLDISDTVIKEEVYNDTDLVTVAGPTLDELVQNAEYTGEYVIDKGGRKLRQRVCPICKKIFVSNYLRKHMLIHEEFKHKQKPMEKVECEVCKVMVVAPYLPNHMRLHTGERPFVCTTCGSSFVTRNALQRHEQTHTHDTHVCPICNKTFTLKKYLEVHKRLHTGEKRHVCSECGKHFPSRASLIVHLRVHSNDKRYICTVCGKPCTTIGNLTDHMLTHTKEKKHECAACGFKFSRVSEMKRHVRQSCKGKLKIASKDSDN